MLDYFKGDRGYIINTNKKVYVVIENENIIGDSIYNYKFISKLYELKLLNILKEKQFKKVKNITELIGG